MIGWSDALAALSGHWAAKTSEGMLNSGSAARYSQVFAAFCRYAEAQRVSSPAKVTPALCRRFLDAPLRQRGGRPCSATSRLRLTVLRSAFQVMVAHGVVAADPTLGLSVHHVARKRMPRPLTPPEAGRLLLAGRSSPLDTLRPVVAALALVGATHREIALAVVADLDQDGALIRLGEEAGARSVELSPAAITGIKRRVAEQQVSWRRRSEPWDPAGVPLALSRPVGTYPVNSVAPTVSDNLRRAMRHAGINRPGLRPKSVREYAANAVYARTHRIEAVAERLGLTSFDTAALLIDHAWQQRWAESLPSGSGDAV